MKYIHIVGGKYNWLVEGGTVAQPRPQGFFLAPPIFLGRNPAVSYTHLTLPTIYSV